MSRKFSRKIGSRFLPFFAIFLLALVFANLIFAKNASAADGQYQGSNGNGYYTPPKETRCVTDAWTETVGAAPGGSTGSAATQSISHPASDTKGACTEADKANGAPAKTVQVDGPCNSGWEAESDRCAADIGTVVSKNYDPAKGTTTTLTIKDAATIETVVTDSSGKIVSKNDDVDNDLVKALCGSLPSGATGWEDITKCTVKCDTGYTVSSDKKSCKTTAPDTSAACNAGGGLGFILCPLMSMLSKVVDSVYGLLDGVLSLPVSIFTGFKDASGKVTNPVKDAFNTFLPFANLLFAIVFLVIIYSEATGNGFGAMSNYSIKKTLPRLVIFAVLVNISFYVCAAAVDLSNILGSGMYDFAKNIKTSGANLKDGDSCFNGKTPFTCESDTMSKNKDGD